MFAALQSRGLPSLLTSSGKLLTHDQYARRVYNYVSNQITSSSSTSEQVGPPSGQIFYDKLENLFYIEHEINHLFEVQPNFYRYIEADETLIKIQRHQLPTKYYSYRSVAPHIRVTCQSVKVAGKKVRCDGSSLKQSNTGGKRQHIKDANQSYNCQPKRGA